MSTLEIMQHRKVQLVEEDRHQHDCVDCSYVGSFAEPMAPGKDPQHLDLYVCSAPGSGLIGDSSVVVRYGDGGPEYSSQPLTLLYKHESKINRWQRAKEILREHIRVEYKPIGELPGIEFSLEQPTNTP